MTQTRDVGILLFDDVEVLDFAGPFEVFSVAGSLVDHAPFRVHTVAEVAGPVRALGGLVVVPDTALADAPAPDVLVVPGGDGSRQAMESPELIRWIQETHQAAEVVMSVCSGARLLARAGLLDGLRVTTHHLVLEDLRALAPEATVDPDRRYVDTGRVVTTGGISAGIDGSLHLVSRLVGVGYARRVAAYMEYDWEAPE